MSIPDITPQAREAAEAIGIHQRREDREAWVFQDCSVVVDFYDDGTVVVLARKGELEEIIDNEKEVKSLLSSRDARIAELEQKLSNELIENRKLKKSSAVYDFQEFVIQQERRLSEILLSPPSPSAVTDDSRIQPKEDER